MTRLMNLGRLWGIAALVVVGASGCTNDDGPKGADAAMEVAAGGSDEVGPDVVSADGGALDEVAADAGTSDDGAVDAAAADADDDGGSDASIDSGGEAGSDAPSPLDSGGLGCSVVPAALEQYAALDDFEDGDNEMLKAPNRTGFWSVSDDDTAGAVRSPPDIFLPEHGGHAGSAYAAHFAANGFTDWGASLNLGLLYQQGGLFCAFNASNFAGIGFYAKGPGKIRFGVPSAAVVPSPENGGLLGGKCDDPSVCWDQHGAVIDLTSEWAYYEVAWRDLHQFGFGTGTLGDLDPGSIMGVAFAVLAGADFQPADFWVDDVRLVKTLAVADGGAEAGDAAAE